MFIPERLFFANTSAVYTAITKLKDNHLDFPEEMRMFKRIKFHK